MNKLEIVMVQGLDYMTQVIYHIDYMTQVIYHIYAKVILTVSAYSIVLMN